MSKKVIVWQKNQIRVEKMNNNCNKKVEIQKGKLLKIMQIYKIFKHLNGEILFVGHVCVL